MLAIHQEVKEVQTAMEQKASGRRSRDAARSRHATEVLCAEVYVC